MRFVLPRSPVVPLEETHGLVPERGLFCTAAGSLATMPLLSRPEPALSSRATQPSPAPRFPADTSSSTITASSASASASFPTSAPPRSIWLLDTETTGLSANNDRIVEVALLSFAPARAAAQSWLVNPGRRVPRAARSVHGIDDDMLQGALSFKDVWPRILAAVENGADVEVGGVPPLVVAHNAKFDRAFVEAEVERAGLEVPNWDWACSIKEVAKAAWPGQAGGHGLAALVAALGITDFGHHRASADVEALAIVLDSAGAVLLEKKMDSDAQAANAHGEFSDLSALTAALERSAASMRDGSRAARRVRTRGADAAVVQAAVEGAVEAAAEQLYYCVQGGQVWHKTLSCVRLRRSNEVDALAAIPGDRRPCSSCAVPPEPEKCSICKDTLNEPLEAAGAGGQSGSSESSATADVTTLVCAHAFHLNCISDWRARSSSCPICRADMSGQVVARSAVGDFPSSPATPSNNAARTNAAGHHRNSGREATLDLPFFGTELGACYHLSASCEGLRNGRDIIRISSAGRRSCGYCRVAPSSSSPVTPAVVERFASSTLSQSAIRADQSGLYYGTDSGQCFHTSRACDGLGNARNVVRVSSSGRRPCRRCAGRTAPRTSFGQTPRRLDFMSSLSLSDDMSSTLSMPPSRALQRGSASSSRVFICPTGTVWHSTDQCRGLGSAAAFARVSSIPSGRRPCKICTR